jgi:hypothetical protein
MGLQPAFYATRLRAELALRNRSYARGRAHVESYGSAPVIVYAPEHPADDDLPAGTTAEGGRHGNFFDASYAAIAARPEWMRRFGKVHAQAARSLPKPQLDPTRRWRELDSCMSSDALLMNIFCAPGVAESTLVRDALGVEEDVAPVFGWKARVPLERFQSSRGVSGPAKGGVFSRKTPLGSPVPGKSNSGTAEANGRFDRTEIDMRFGSLLVEAKLTEAGFQSRAAPVVEAYRDFDTVFDRDLLPRTEIATTRWIEAGEFPENQSQELESLVGDPALFSAVETSFRAPGESGYASYQLIRGVLAAHAAECCFCVLHDERRPDLREEWYQVMAAVRSAALRVRLKVLTWQELAALLPNALQDFLDQKYGIVAPGESPSPINEATGPKAEVTDPEAAGL